MRIVLDATGGDNAPSATIAAAIQAARATGDQIILVGDEAIIRQELTTHTTNDLDLPIVHADEVIEMTEHPAQAVRRKKQSPVAIGLRMVRDGEADAFVSAGHSGATMAGALFILGRIKGIERPCLGTRFPTATGWVLLVDAGATTDCKPDYLVQFAKMGSIYAKQSLQLERPRVGLLANGEEANKGDKLVQDAHILLQNQSDIHFVGNIEPKDMLVNNLADVIVADGFVGNLTLKTSEAVVKLLIKAIASESKKQLGPRIIAGLAPVLIAALLPGGGKKKALLAGLTGLSLPAAAMVGPLRNIQKRMDYRVYGGAPLLGVNGIAIVAHGKSDSQAIYNAIQQARRCINEQLVESITTSLETEAANI